MINNSKKKICQLCAVDFTLEKFLLPLIDVQKASGFEVIAVCSDGSNINNLRKRGYQIKTIPIERSLNPIKLINSVWKLYNFFTNEKFDLVHVHTPIAALIGRIAARMAGVPKIVYTAHGFYFHDEMPKLKRQLHIWIEKFGGKFTTLLFTQNNEDAIAAVNLGIMESKKVFAIGNGVNIEKFNPEIINSETIIRQEFSIPKTAFVIGMISRLVKEKGVLEFLDSAKFLAPKYSNLWFILVGDRLESDYETSVDSQIKEAKIHLKNRLIITGMRNDIPQILSSINLYTLPSWREGMPRTIIEAMMMGLPVVATNIRGSKELIIDQKTGLLVPLRDHVRLAKAFETIISDDALRKQMGNSGRKRALQLYDENTVITKQIKLINKIFI